MEVQSLDAHFVAMVDNLDGPVILKLNELVVERNFRDVYLYLNAVRLPQRAGYREFTVHRAGARQILQMKPRGYERVEIELLGRETAGNDLIPRQFDSKVACQLALRHFRIESDLGILAVRLYLRAKISLVIGSDL